MAEGELTSLIAGFRLEGWVVSRYYGAIERESEVVMIGL